MTHVRVDVDPLRCGAPPDEVEETLEARSGVAGAAVDLEGEVVELRFEDDGDEPEVEDLLDFFGLEVRGVERSPAA